MSLRSSFVIGGENIQAAILTGGKSSRMGRDKALIPFEGQPLLEHIYQQLNNISQIEKVFAVGDRPEYHGRGIEIVPDRYPGAGPLGGIASALDHADTEFVLVVATDMPFLSQPLIEAMISVDRNYDVLVPVRVTARGGQRGNQTYETLHAIYSKRATVEIEKKLTEGDYRVVGFFDSVVVQELDEVWARQFDPELTSLVNVNRPEELQIAHQQVVAETRHRTTAEEG